MVEIHELVKESKKYNFEHCRIPVNNRLNFSFMRKMLRDYSDIQVCDLLEFGFPIGFKGDENSFPRFSNLSKCRNHKGAIEFTKEINSYLEKESAEKTILGPFKQNPFSDNLVLSPLNSLPKKNTEERRVILDLSHPKSKSINDFIDKDFYLGHQTDVVYPKVDDMVELVKIKGKGCLLFKKDLRRAYRQISICPSDYNLVAFSWGKHIFCDTVLSMGLKSAAAICQRVSNAITFMMFQLGISILNYLDDLAGAETAEKAEFAYNCLGTVLKKCGIKESVDKASPPAEIMTFLGVLFNTRTMTIEVTPERLDEIRNLIEQWLVKQYATVKEIQSLLGKLNFVASCVKPSRIFVSRLLSWLRSLNRLNEKESRLPEYVKKDLQWWHRFLPVYNGVSMMQYENWSNPDTVFSSDACSDGCGGFWHGAFFHAKFPPQFMEKPFHITALEVIAIIICLKFWGSSFKGKRIVVFCDNMAACQIINTGKSRCHILQECLREICFLAAIYEFEIKSIHLDSASNRIADHLSRWHLDCKHKSQFLELTREFSLKEEIVDNTMFQFINNW